MTHSAHPLAVGSRLEEDDGRLAVPALHREVERCVSRTVGGVEARLRTALGRVEEDVQKRSVASCCGAVQWMLVGTVPCIDLHTSATAPTAAACENTHIGSTRNEKPAHLLVSDLSDTRVHSTHRHISLRCSVVKRSLTLLVRSVDLGAGVEQLRHVLRLPRGRGQQERGGAHGVARLDICRVGQQKLRHAQVVARSGPMERGAAVLLDEARPGRGRGA